jgi:hypothetical protein
MQRAHGPAFWRAVGVVESFRPSESAQSVGEMQAAVVAAGGSQRTAQAATAFVREFYDLDRWANGMGPVIGPRRDEPEPTPAPQFCTCGGKVLAYDRESPSGSRLGCLTCTKRPRKPIKATAVLIHSRRPGGVDSGDYSGPPRSVRASRSAGNRADADLSRELQRAGLLGETSNFGPGYWH